MSLVHGRNSLFVGFAGAVGLLMATALTARPTALYAQEDESFSATPVPDDETGAASAPAPDGDEDASDQVLELPQVIAVHHDGDSDGADAPDATADAADSSDPTEEMAESGGPTADNADQAGDVNDYADQQAISSTPVSTFAAATPAEPILPPTRIAGTNWPPSGFIPYIVARPFGYARIPATSPMLSVPRGSHMIMGGWWQHGRR